MIFMVVRASNLVYSNGERASIQRASYATHIGFESLQITNRRQKRRKKRACKLQAVTAQFSLFFTFFVAFARFKEIRVQCGLAHGDHIKALSPIEYTMFDALTITIIIHT